MAAEVWASVYYYFFFKYGSFDPQINFIPSVTATV